MPEQHRLVSLVHQIFAFSWLHASSMYQNKELVTGFVRLVFLQWEEIA